jgi:hypothetical protein
LLKYEPGRLRWRLHLPSSSGESIHKLKANGQHVHKTLVLRSVQSKYQRQYQRNTQRPFRPRGGFRSFAVTCLCWAILRICLEMCLARVGCAAPTGISWAVKARGKAMGSVSEGYACWGGGLLIPTGQKNYIYRRCIEEVLVEYMPQTTRSGVGVSPLSVLRIGL